MELKNKTIKELLDIGKKTLSPMFSKSGRSTSRSDMQELEDMEIRSESQDFIKDDEENDLDELLSAPLSAEHNDKFDIMSENAYPAFEEMVSLDDVSDDIEIEKQDVDTENTIEQSAEPEKTLLDNRQYMSLVEQCCNIYEEISRIEEQVADEQLIQFISMQKGRIREALALTGGTLINGESEFNLLRHMPVPVTVANNGTPIVQTIEPGVEIEERVIIKAKVKLNIEE